MFIPLKYHAANLAHAILELEDADAWLPIAEWLVMAASVESVKLDTIQHNPSFGWCSPADDYAGAREELLEDLAKRLSIFSFSWNAVECAIRLAKPPSHHEKSKRGRVRSACYYIAGHFSAKPGVRGLDQETELFRVAAMECLDKKRVEQKFSEILEFGKAAIGLYTVYELRNSFAHGSLPLPEPDFDNEPRSAHAAMLEHATRILLMSTQMLSLAITDESDEAIHFSGYGYDRIHEYPLSAVLRSCHLVREDEGGQLKLLSDA